MTAGRQVAILEPGYADYSIERQILGPLGAVVTPVSGDHHVAASIARLSPCAIMVREAAVPAEIINACSGLKVIVRYGVGVDNIDLEAARERRIYVANVPDYGAENEVSDHALALFLAVARRVVSRDAEVRAGLWSVGQSQAVFSYRNATLGMIGFGRIAREACRKYRVFGFDRVLVSDPALDAQSARSLGVETADLDEICRQADLLSLHASLNPETRHILNRRRIGLMKPTAIVVNVARGGLIDEAALANALAKKQLFGAGLDVFETEPPPPDHPLMSAPNTVFSDHTGWYSEATVAALQTKAAKQVVSVFRGKRPDNWVNRW